MENSGKSLVTRIAVIYHSAQGTTEALARSVIAGANGLTGTEAVGIKVTGEEIVQGRYRNQRALEQLDAADGIVFGSPTFMGCVSAQFKAFMDATSERYSRRSWAGKLAAGFTIGSSPSGDQLNTLQTLQVFASQHGMLWIGIDLPAGSDAAARPRLGAQSGLVAAHSAAGEVHRQDHLTAEYLGSRVGELAGLLSRGTGATGMP
ncbi:MULTISPECIES: flavodoxin family protein [unclassified Microbulbifer]|uniref:flavodoxin family protein n=1 Tax=unclassified Microbulbifer TaxID=2619833 RepID=UPI0027E3CB73|nr:MULTISPECIES: flavodoxin family protein [unclassified Microbulbifer]